ncbi:MAG: 16S rRNA (adenine(1518)-N(6)/adenine(1519)-N(6))-dimethyltransferase RsmA, partial [Coriobacteriia bacterium]|nr:16S rRNA (adenine(1518)-N(6)/adenine(1519)-N(6))-dimethyltransferase RsmA [Coriobacteriia bacterium]
MDSQDSSLRPSQSLHSPLATPKATIETLQAFGLYTKKRLGQHFLIDDNVIARILNAADLNADDQVLEIGPGIGVLTVALLSRVEKVLALEYDAQLIEVLEYATQEYALQSDGDVSQADGRKLQAGGVSQADRGISQAGNKLTILHEDALNIPQLDLPLHPTKLVANLPYQVAATNVLDCFEYIPSIQQATVMVQK